MNPVQAEREVGGLALDKLAMWSLCVEPADTVRPPQIIICSAQVVSEDVGLALDKLDLSSLGRAKKVTISKDDTIVLDGAGEKEAIAERCDQLRESIDASTSDYDREKLQARTSAVTWACVKK